MATSQRTTSTSQSDIISKIKHDHEELEEYFSNYKEAHKGGNHEEAGKWFNQFVWEISRHAVSEELVLYPLMALQGQRGQELADISRKDHQVTKNILEELQNTSDPEMFDKKMEQMMADLREHMKKEENEDLAYLEENVSAKDRETAGTTFRLGKKIAPTRPHAGVPNKSAALEAALGLLITPIDKFQDLFTAYPSKN
jgi:hemerythrin superfamily protein